MKNLMFNKALLSKWLWRDRNEQNSLWRQVIVLMYRFQRGGWCLEEARDPYKVSLWTNIRKDWGSFFNFVSYKNGEGSRIRVWHDTCCGEGALKYSFSDFYSIARNKEALVSDYLDLSSSHIL
jgi:hypothetical protein